MRNNGTFQSYDSTDDKDNKVCQEVISANDGDFYRAVDYGDIKTNRNENALLLPDGGSVESDKGDLDQEEAQRQSKYRHKHRFTILALVALTPTGVKFFKAAQSSFQEYLMTDPRILMSATTYSLSLWLLSFPVVTLIGGAMLDYKPKKENKNKKRCIVSNQQSCTGTSRTPSYSAVFFIGITLLGTIIYGYGLETLSSIPVGLAGAAIFGMGEGCVVVASRTFVAHAFYGSDGAFAQGVLVAMNNIAMMASKLSLPWLIENQRKMRIVTYFASSREYSTDDTEHNIWIGVVVCCMVQLFSLSASIIYALWFGWAPLPQSQHSSQEKSSTKKSALSRVIACFETLPMTFWIVAIGRAIFVVVFKVFTRNSNSFLMEKFGVSPVAAGIKSSFHELFALGSPVVGYLAYRSPGGIVPVLLFAAALGLVSIATLACVPAAIIQLYLPGGALTPVIGISIAHGIFIPICMAIIPQTCSPDQTGMAFSVVEVLGSIFNLTNILFGWLRDATGNYEVPMEVLLLYTLVGMCLLWISRNHIKLKQPGDQ